MISKVFKWTIGTYKLTGEEQQCRVKLNWQKQGIVVVSIVVKWYACHCAKKQTKSEASWYKYGYKKQKEGQSVYLYSHCLWVLGLSKARKNENIVPLTNTPAFDSISLQVFIIHNMLSIPHTVENIVNQQEFHWLSPGTKQKLNFVKWRTDYNKASVQKSYWAAVCQEKLLPPKTSQIQ